MLPAVLLQSERVPVRHINADLTENLLSVLRAAGAMPSSSTPSLLLCR